MIRALKRTVGALLLTSAAVGLAACSQPTTGTPAPANTTAAQGSSVSQAPPLDVESYRSRPCDLVDAATLGSLGYSKPGSPDTTGKTSALITGQSCSWDDFTGPKTKTIQIQIALKNSNLNSPGLTAIFNNQKSGLVAYAEPAEVSGYQAVFADLTDERADGRCPITVAISDTQLLSATADGYTGPQDSCDTAKQLAEAMIKTLGGS